MKKVTFFVSKDHKVLDFELNDDMIVQNLNIYDRLSARNILQDVKCELTTIKLLELLRYYLGGNGTIEEYVDHILNNGFYTPYVPSLDVKIE